MLNMLRVNLVCVIWPLLFGKGVANFLASFFGNEYCHLEATHVLCNGGGFDSNCGSQYIFKEITEAERQRALHVHNDYRNQVARGGVSAGIGTLPSAANMEELKWDSEMEAISSAMVKKCYHHGHYCEDTKCMKSLRYPFIGENLHMRWGQSSVEGQYGGITYDIAIADWFREKDIYDAAEISNNRHGVKNSLNYDHSSYGHLVMMLWHNTLRVGCAKIAYTWRNGTTEGILACHYAPGGNYANQPVYQRGQPCSRCAGAGRKCSTKYPALCAAEGRPNDPDPPDSSTNPLLLNRALLVCLLGVLWVYF